MTILILLLSMVSYSQSTISVEYSYYDFTPKEQFEIYQPYSIEIDLQNGKIYVRQKDYEKITFDITETNGPLYQSARNSDDLLKYYQFETISGGKRISVRYYVDKKMGFFILLDNEGQKFMRHYNKI